MSRMSRTDGQQEERPAVRCAPGRRQSNATLLGRRRLRWTLLRALVSWICLSALTCFVTFHYYQPYDTRIRALSGHMLREPGWATTWDGCRKTQEILRGDLDRAQRWGALKQDRPLCLANIGGPMKKRP
jgi:hypothetical protein